MKEYTEKDMIQFGVHVSKKENQNNLDIEWELTEYLGGKSIEKLNLACVTQRSEQLNAFISHCEKHYSQGCDYVYLRSMIKTFKSI